MTTATSPSARQGTYRRFFVVVLGLWVVLSFIPQADFAQDAVPIVVAGELVGDHPDAVYGEGIYEMDDEFVARSCDFVPAGESCDELAVAFLSTPMALPLAWSVALAPDDLGVDLLRLVTSVSLAAGLLVLWKRLVGLHPSMPAILFWSALILTPLALVAVDLGTTSALLFLSACLGLRHTDDRPARRAGTGRALGRQRRVAGLSRGARPPGPVEASVVGPRGRGGHRRGADGGVARPRPGVAARRVPAVVGRRRRARRRAIHATARSTPSSTCCSATPRTVRGPRRSSSDASCSSVGASSPSPGCAPSTRSGPTARSSVCCCSRSSGRTTCGW